MISEIIIVVKRIVVDFFPPAFNQRLDPSSNFYSSPNVIIMIYMFL